jgi:hypothetical protein
LHVINERNACLKDKLLNESSIIDIKINNCEEELPHSWADLMLVVKKFSQASDSILNG